jgi:cystathionine beta-lyase
LSHPQNPLGRVFSEGEILQLAAFCMRHNLVLVSDEIHCDLIYDEDTTPFFSALRLPADLAKRAVVLLSPSKTYNIAGLGYAYAVIPDDRLRRGFVQARGHLLAEINCLSFYAAEAAYRHGESWRRDLLSYLQGNRDLLAQFCRVEAPGVVMPAMEATYLAWLDFRPLGIDEPASFLEREAGLFLTDGRLFGSPGHARINFGCARSLLREALDAIRTAVA